MDEATSTMARFIIICTIALASAEFLTRSERATVRWVLLAVVWVIIVAMLFWTMGVG